MKLELQDATDTLEALLWRDAVSLSSHLKTLVAPTQMSLDQKDFLTHFCPARLSPKSYTALFEKNQKSRVGRTKCVKTVSSALHCKNHVNCIESDTDS